MRKIPGSPKSTDFKPLLPEQLGEEAEMRVLIEFLVTNHIHPNQEISSDAKSVVINIYFNLMRNMQEIKLTTLMSLTNSWHGKVSELVEGYSPDIRDAAIKKALAKFSVDFSMTCEDMSREFAIKRDKSSEWREEITKSLPDQSIASAAASFAGLDFIEIIVKLIVAQRESFKKYFEELDEVCAYLECGDKKYRSVLSYDFFNQLHMAASGYKKTVFYAISNFKQLLLLASLYPDLIFRYDVYSKNIGFSYLTSQSFFSILDQAGRDIVERLNNCIDPKTGKTIPNLDKETDELIQSDPIKACIIEDNDKFVFNQDGLMAYFALQAQAMLLPLATDELKASLAGVDEPQKAQPLSAKISFVKKHALVYLVTQYVVKRELLRASLHRLWTEYADSEDALDNLEGFKLDVENRKEVLKRFAEGNKEELSFESRVLVFIEAVETLHDVKAGQFLDLLKFIQDLFGDSLYELLMSKGSEFRSDALSKDDDANTLKVLSYLWTALKIPYLITNPEHRRHISQKFCKVANEFITDHDEQAALLSLQGEIESNPDTLLTRGYAALCAAFSMLWWSVKKDGVGKVDFDDDRPPDSAPFYNGL